VALGLGGLVFLFGGGGPAETVRNFYDALNRGDTDTADKLRHDDGVGVIDGPVAELYAEGVVSVQNTQVVENTGSKALVQTTLSITLPDLGDSETDDHTVELRKQGGEWRIWMYSHTL
jgi:ketosteroid isomerase-like protein